MKELNELERRVVDISYEKGLSHLGSCLTSVNFIDHTFNSMEEGDTFVLGNSHAALALYVVLEKHKGHDAGELFDQHGVHAVRDLEHDIHVSGGSLGQAETIAVGMAMANKDKTVYLVTSDGACAEGSVWEALRIASEQKVENLRVAVIANGYSAYKEVDTDLLDERLNLFFPTLVVRTNMFAFPDWLQGLDAHYAVMNEDMYKEITNGN